MIRFGEIEAHCRKRAGVIETFTIFPRKTGGNVQCTLEFKKIDIHSVIIIIN